MSHIQLTAGFFLFFFPSLWKCLPLWPQSTIWGFHLLCGFSDTWAVTTIIKVDIFYSVAVSRDGQVLSPSVSGLRGLREHKIQIRTKKIREAGMNRNCNAMFSLLQWVKGWRDKDVFDEEDKVEEALAFDIWKAMQLYF